MVTTYGTSAAADISHFFRTQGNLFVPILADLAVYSIFQKSRNYQVSELAGAITGIATYFVFYQRNSLTIHLLGTAVYLAYKVTHYFYASLSSLTPEVLLAKRFDELNKIATNNEASLEEQDFPDGEMDFLHEAEMIMSKASVLIRKKLQEAEEGVELNEEDRNKEIVDQLDEDFYFLIPIFTQTFDLVKQRAKQVLSAESSKPEEQAKEEIADLFCKKFGPCNRMNNLYFRLYCDLSPLIPYLSKEIQKLVRENDPDLEVMLQEAEQEEEQPSADLDNLPVPEAD